MGTAPRYRLTIVPQNRTGRNLLTKRTGGLYANETYVVRGGWIVASFSETFKNLELCRVFA